MNSEGFRETFLRSDREDPKRPRWRAETKPKQGLRAHMIRDQKPAE